MLFTFKTHQEVLLFKKLQETRQRSVRKILLLKTTGREGHLEVGRRVKGGAPLLSLTEEASLHKFQYSTWLVFGDLTNQAVGEKLITPDSKV